jgi:hypothetical protein
MRLLLFILGVFAAVVCVEKPAAAGPWCAYIVGSQHFNNVWLP